MVQMNRLARQKQRHRSREQTYRHQGGKAVGGWGGGMNWEIEIDIYTLICIDNTGSTLRCGVWSSHCGGLSCCGARALGARASVAVAHGLSSCGSRALECRLSSCGAWA